jgi:hypothetical protein
VAADLRVTDRDDHPQLGDAAPPASSSGAAEPIWVLLAQPPSKRPKRRSDASGAAPAAGTSQARDATSIRPGYRHLQWIYCTRRDDELVALALEQMTAVELLEVIGKLLTRGAHTEAAELVAWLRGGAS